MKIANFEKSDKCYERGGNGVLREARQRVTHPSGTMPNLNTEGHGNEVAQKEEGPYIGHRAWRFLQIQGSIMSEKFEQEGGSRRGRTGGSSQR